MAPTPKEQFEALIDFIENYYDHDHEDRENDHCRRHVFEVESAEAIASSTRGLRNRARKIDESAPFLLNPAIKHGKNSFSMQIFVNTDPGDPLNPEAYEPATVYYVPKNSPYCGREIYTEKLQSGFYIETQPGRRFIVVAEHWGEALDVRTYSSETMKREKKKAGAGARVELHFDLSLEPNYCYTVPPGGRYAVLGSTVLVHNAPIVRPFVFSENEFVEVSSSGSTAAAGDAAASSSSSSSRSAAHPNGAGEIKMEFFTRLEKVVKKPKLQPPSPPPTPPPQPPPPQPQPSTPNVNLQPVAAASQSAAESQPDRDQSAAASSSATPAAPVATSPAIKKDSKLAISIGALATVDQENFFVCDDDYKLEPPAPAPSPSPPVHAYASLDPSHGQPSGNTNGKKGKQAAAAAAGVDHEKSQGKNSKLGSEQGQDAIDKEKDKGKCKDKEKGKEKDKDKEPKKPKTPKKRPEPVIECLRTEKLVTLTVYYRSKLWMALAGLRPDLVRADADADADAAEGSSSQGDANAGAGSSGAGAQKSNSAPKKDPVFVDLSSDTEEEATFLPATFCPDTGIEPVNFNLKISGCPTAAELYKAVAAAAEVGPPPRGKRHVVSFHDGDKKVKILPKLSDRSYCRLRDKATEVFIILETVNLETVIEEDPDSAPEDT